MAGAQERSPYVDYRRAAAVYDAGRSPSAALLDRWRDAVLDRVPPIGDLRVADVGAGTGLFAEAWATWGARQVVAVEPSGAMRDVAVARRGRAFAVVAGAAESLPLGTASVEVVWLSTVLHHVADRGAVAVEARRVLAPGGRVLVRGFFPGHSAVAWLGVLPGAERATARFPSVATAAAAFETAGLALADACTVEDPAPVAAGDAASWIEAMRGADSLLTALTDDEIRRGLQRLRRAPDAVLGRSALSLLSFA